MNRRGFLSLLGLAPVAAAAAMRASSASATSAELRSSIISGVCSVGEMRASLGDAPAALQFEPISLRSCDLEFIAERRFSVEEICRIYSIHLDEIGSAA